MKSLGFFPCVHQLKPLRQEYTYDMDNVQNKKTGWLIEPNIDFEKTQNYKIIESVCKQCLLLGSSILNSLCP